MSALKVLVYDRNFHKASSLCDIIKNAGYDVSAAFYAEEASAREKEFNCGLLIASFDLFPLPACFKEKKLIVSAPAGRFAEVGATLAQYGAACITEPYDAEAVIKRIELTVSGAAEKETKAKEAGMPEMAGSSKAINDMREIVATAAKVESSVLILGETGTGKELVARALHRLSCRAKGPFIALNCGSLAESLLESELFGHQRGAFTGAVNTHAGKLEAADGGTLFLDEVGDMPRSLQVKLLRVLETGLFHPVGSEVEKKTDFRLVSATNRDIFRMASDSSFRRDLLYRINVIAISLPPLRERGGDIEILADIFLKRFAEKYNKKVKGFSVPATQSLKRHRWPGNIRELENVVERSVVQCKGDTVDDLKAGKPAIDGKGSLPDMNRLVELDFISMKEEVLSHYEKEYLDALLSLEGGALQNVAKRCGIDRKTLYRKMKQYRLDKKDFR